MKRRRVYRRNMSRRNQAMRKAKEHALANPLKYDPNAKPGVFPLQYFNYPEYNEKSAEDKMKDLWAACEADQSTAPFPWVDWGQLFNLNLARIFSFGDEMPEGEKKLTHAQGVVAKVNWEPVNNANGYTGEFASGSKNVIMRLSETSMLHEGSKGLTPSVAFKILRDGQYSDNIVAMPAFSSSTSWNFFEKGM